MVAETAESHLISWAYWMYKGYNDFTTTSDSYNQGLFIPSEFKKDLSDIKLQDKKLKALTRSYVQIYQGEPTSAWFNNKTSRFVSQFNLDLRVNIPTQLFVSKEYYYKSDPVISLNF